MAQKKSPLTKFEEKFGLPKLDRVVDVTDRVSKIPSGESGKRVERILNTLEKLSSSEDSLNKATELLEVVERLDSRGTLSRVDQTLKDAKPIVNSNMGKELSKRVDRFTSLIEDIFHEK